MLEILREEVARRVSACEDLKLLDLVAKLLIFEEEEARG